MYTTVSVPVDLPTKKQAWTKIRCKDNENNRPIGVDFCQAAEIDEGAAQVEAIIDLEQQEQRGTPTQAT